MDFASRLAEERIQKAIKEGAFDDLEGKGKPLTFEEDQGVPEELRLSYKILKNAGFVPKEVEAQKEIIQLKQFVEACVDPDEEVKLKKKLSEKTLRYNQLMEQRKWSSSSSFRRYRHKLTERFF
ncbi:DUF1992 domain-containing protein [Halalkalibacterium halodurans]|uniref:DnaJ family domain-containing protein n=1 Tax=Halalkalibacterium halodurans TaxID=86665 RepID=UPI002E1DD74D|nr:DUF1992 domain-containing protein [Halalkalibacterium halodurans]